MAKTNPSFAGDLDAIQGQVESDVSTILQLAKQQQSGSHADSPTTDNPPGKQRGRDRPGGSSRPASTSTPAGRKTLPPVSASQSSPLCNVTTRLSFSTNERLTAAALHQRLKKAVPSTRQDIIEQAVRQWLERHGYDGPP